MENLDKHFREKINRPRNLTEFIEFFGNYYKERTGEDLSPKKEESDFNKGLTDEHDYGI